jgi:hypothetical protein
MVSDEAKANRRARDWTERRLRAEAAPPAGTPPPVEPPAPGTIAFGLAVAEQSRAHLAGVADLRNPAHREVERMRGEMLAACDQKHGRRPSLDPAQYSEAETFAALAALEDREAEYIRAAGTRGVSRSYVGAAREAFGAALLRFANAATRGWPSRKEYERRQAEHMRTW